MENWKGNKYVERLIKEWLAYGKIVLACDFDDTIYPWGFKTEEDLKFMIEVIRVVNLAQEVGVYLALWSACAPDRYDELRDWCTKMQTHVDSINENPIPLPYGNNRKMYYNHLLDDRAGLEQALDMLEYACYRVQSERKQPTINFDV